MTVENYILFVLNIIIMIHYFIMFVYLNNI